MPEAASLHNINVYTRYSSSLSITYALRRRNLSYRRARDMSRG